MQIFQWIKRAVQFVFDPDVYDLAWLAIRNHWKQKPAQELAPCEDKKKHAKAINIQ